MNVTRADSEFRKLVRDEKLLWDEIGPLIEEVAETNKIAFERLKTMLERVRNADIQGSKFIPPAFSKIFSAKMPQNKFEKFSSLLKVTLITGVWLLSVYSRRNCQSANF